MRHLGEQKVATSAELGDLPTGIGCDIGVQWTLLAGASGAVGSGGDSSTRDWRDGHVDPEAVERLNTRASASGSPMQAATSSRACQSDRRRCRTTCASEMGNAARQPLSIAHQ